MAYSETLANRIREAIAQIPKIEEKKMFGGLAFLVNDKMCINIGEDRIMCRINPAIFDEVIEKPGCSPVIMKGRELKGYVYIDEDRIQDRQDFDYWISLALDYNKMAKASTKNKAPRKKI